MLEQPAICSDVNKQLPVLGKHQQHGQQREERLKRSSKVTNREKAFQTVGRFASYRLDTRHQPADADGAESNKIEERKNVEVEFSVIDRCLLAQKNCFNRNMNPSLRGDLKSQSQRLLHNSMQMFKMQKIKNK